MGKKVAEAKRESVVWEIVRRERKRKKQVDTGIDVMEWKEFFMWLLGGVDSRVVKGGEIRREEEDKEEEIREEEFRRVIRRLKIGKAGLDEIPNEVWKYGGEEMEGWARGFYNKVWKENEWPEE